jgi:hypothetical protein
VIFVREEYGFGRSGGRKTGVVLKGGNLIKKLILSAP